MTAKAGTPNTQDAAVLRIVRDAAVDPSSMQVLRVARRDDQGKATGRAHHYCTHPVHPTARYVKIGGPCFRQLAGQGAVVVDMSRADFGVAQGQRVDRPLRLPRGTRAAAPSIFSAADQHAQASANGHAGVEDPGPQAEAAPPVAGRDAGQADRSAAQVLADLRHAWAHGLPAMIMSTSTVLRAQAVTRLEDALG